MLNLNPYWTSRFLAQQLFQGNHEIPLILPKLISLVDSRWSEESVVRDSGGSVGVGTAMCLYLMARRLSPSTIVEVGTYVGVSTAALGLGGGKSKKLKDVITCDVNPCIPDPFIGMDIDKSIKCSVMNVPSHEMFSHLANKDIKADLINIDGRLSKRDIEPLVKVVKPTTVFALDDCESDQKGHVNLALLRSVFNKTHFFVAPFLPEDLILDSSIIGATTGTGYLVPKSLVSFSTQ